MDEKFFGEFVNKDLATDGKVKTGERKASLKENLYAPEILAKLNKMKTKQYD